MKKVFVAALALISISNATNAQKGSVLLYGNVGIGSDKSGDADANTTWNLSPGIGYQFNDNWTAGLNLGLGGSKNELGTKTSDFNVGPFVRYAKSLTNIFSVYGQADLDFLNTKYTPVVGDAIKEKGFGLNIFPAIGVNIKNGFALNFDFGGLGYNTTKLDFDGAKSNNSFGLNFGKTINIGISKNFASKK